MLVFPRVTKGGVGIGGEFGEGVLQVNGKTVGYYSVGAATVGLTLGLANHSEIIMFMTQESLDKFISQAGWSIGADAGITVVSGGANGSYDTETAKKPILGFVFAEKGLIGDLSLEGSKISKIKKANVDWNRSGAAGAGLDSLAVAVDITDPMYGNRRTRGAAFR